MASRGDEQTMSTIATPAVHGTDERYRAASVKRFALGNGQELVHFR